MRRVVTHTVRGGQDREVWAIGPRGVKTEVFKHTVRVAKGDPSRRGGQFHGATNLRGTILPAD